MEPWPKNKRLDIDGKSKICIFDIDGVLNTYPDCWVDFIFVETGIRFNSLDEAKSGLSYNYYKQLKEKYRTSGYKKALPTKPFAKQVLIRLRDMGYLIVIISARPIIKYPMLYKLTIDWLNENGFVYDNIIFSDRKQYEILKYYPDINFMVEDNRLIANLVSRLGYTVYLVDNKYNQGYIDPKVIRINTLSEILLKLEGENENA